MHISLRLLKGYLFFLFLGSILENQAMMMEGDRQDRPAARPLSAPPAPPSTPSPTEDSASREASAGCPPGFCALVTPSPRSLEEQAAARIQQWRGMCHPSTEFTPSLLQFITHQLAGIMLSTPGDEDQWGSFATSTYEQLVAQKVSQAEMWRGLHKIVVALLKEREAAAARVPSAPVSAAAEGYLP